MAEELATAKGTPSPTTYGGIKKSPSSTNLKGGPMNVLKVAMHMLRRKKSLRNKKQQPTTPAAPPSSDSLTRFVGSVRPLHHHGLASPPPPPPPPLLTSSQSCVDFGMLTSSPGAQSDSSFFSGRSPSASSSSGGTISRYASFQSLYELGISDDEFAVSEEADAYYDGMEGDELIDSKAETFIAQYYRTQLKMNSSNPNNQD